MSAEEDARIKAYWDKKLYGDKGPPESRKRHKKTNWNQELQDLGDHAGELFHDVKVNAKDAKNYYTGKPSNFHINMIIAGWVLVFSSWVFWRFYIGGEEMPGWERKVCLYFHLWIALVLPLFIGWEWFKMKIEIFRFVYPLLNMGLLVKNIGVIGAYKPGIFIVTDPSRFIVWFVYIEHPCNTPYEVLYVGH